MDRKAWEQALAPYMERLLEIRHDLHRHPERSGQEKETQATLMRVLAPLGLKLTTFPGSYALMATLENGAGGCVAVRADMDALPITEETGLPFASENPGVMHACGHDVHMTLALGSAMYLSAHRDAWKGTVKWLFEPQEETIGGGRQMTECGCMSHPTVDVVIGQHVNPRYPAGTFFCKTGYVSGASDEVQLHVIGKSCHGAYPEGGIDAIVIMASIVTALQTMVSRRVSPFVSTVLTFGTVRGGTANNVICGDVYLTGTLRTLDEKTRRTMKHQIRRMAVSIAEGMGGAAEVVFRPSYGAVFNSEPYYTIVEDAAREVLGEENLVHREAPSLGVESFYYFIAHTPGVYYDIGSGISTALHTPTFCVDEKTIGVGIALQTESVLRLLKKTGEDRA